jgi:ABC-type amino acid transport system permease subunit
MNASVAIGAQYYQVFVYIVSPVAILVMDNQDAWLI